GGGEQKRSAFFFFGGGGGKVHTDLVQRVHLSGFKAKVASLEACKHDGATCNKYAEYFATAVSRNESGKTAEDIIADVHVLSREKNCAGFRAKWHRSLASKKRSRKRRGGDPDKTDDTNLKSTTVKRLVGRKSAKAVKDIKQSLLALVAKLASETKAKIACSKKPRTTKLWFVVSKK
ncbi:hypothetical protein GN958_ATG10393, partial [Phytophthora infestans]